MLDLGELRALLTGVKEEEQPGYENEEAFDPAKVSPVFYGKHAVKTNDLKKVINLDETVAQKKDEHDASAELDVSVVHPATFGYTLLERKPIFKKDSIELPNPKTCSPCEYLEFYVFPVLMPALEAMFPAAKQARVFERRRTSFNACDFLTEFLYKFNPRFTDRQDATLLEIPFVIRMLAENPRPPLPLSLLLSDEEAAIIIQSHYRGYMVRKDPEVQELREYQREMREEAVDINLKVEDFWRKHPVEETSGKEDTMNSFTK